MVSFNLGQYPYKPEAICIRFCHGGGGGTGGRSQLTAEWLTQRSGVRGLESKLIPISMKPVTDFLYFSSTNKDNMVPT